MTTEAIWCSTVTDPQVQNPQPEEFCHQQPHNIAFQRAEATGQNRMQTCSAREGSDVR